MAANAEPMETASWAERRFRYLNAIDAVTIPSSPIPSSSLLYCPGAAPIGPIATETSPRVRQRDMERKIRVMSGRLP